MRFHKKGIGISLSHLTNLSVRYGSKIVKYVLIPFEILSLQGVKVVEHGKLRVKRI